MDICIYKLYRQPEYYTYKALIRVDNCQFIAKLQSEPTLTLDIAVQISRRCEAANQAKTVVHPSAGTVESVGAHRSKPKPKSSKNKPTSMFDSQLVNKSLITVKDLMT